MKLKVIILEKRQIFVPIWHHILDDLNKFTITLADAQTLIKDGQIDAEVMLSIVAHERFGGNHTIGESQIVNSNDDLYLSKWIVTTPAFSAHLVKIKTENGVELKIVRDSQISPKEESFEVFFKIFKKINDFNLESQEQKIKTLLINARALNIGRINAEVEITAIKKAYLEVFG
jgi:hypothetical protein